MTAVMFYMFSALILFSAFNVIVNRNPIYSVLSLIFCFFSVALLWLNLNTILALFLIVIYVGAVMVLFLFIIMMINIELEHNGKWYQLKFAWLMAILLLLEILAMIFYHPILLPNQHNVNQVTDGGIYVLSYILYTHYNYAVELVSIILLLGLIIAVVLNKQTKTSISIYQNINKQMRVKKSERLSMVDLEV